VVESIFGVPWNGLTLDAVQAFLVDAGDEGLTWEAKGTERPRPGSVRKHVCAFANSIGGFFIVGASRDGETGPWRLDPIEFEGDEPGPWFSKVIRNGLQPVPRYDVNEWTIDGKRVAIVNIDPIAEPPCMTTSGEVFTRVSGESPRVEDPATLRRLYDRGETRAATAEAEALRAAELPEAGRQLADEAFLRVRLAYAPTGRAEDVAGQLFARAFADTLLEATRSLPPAPLLERGANEASLWYVTSQSALAVHHLEGFQRWTLRASWDGAVAAYLDVTTPTQSEDIHLEATDIFGSAVAPAAGAAEQVVKELGGYGRAHVALQVFGRQFWLRAVQGQDGRIPHWADPVTIQTWTDADGHLGDAALNRMRRELTRACGVLVWEPNEHEEQEGQAASRTPS
jgi:hypothetical protein